jgi:hypothetical protein
MKLSEWIPYFFEKYSLLALLILEAALLLLALIAIIAFLCLVPGWKVVSWFGLVGVVIILGIIAYGIADEIRHIRKL